MASHLLGREPIAIDAPRLAGRPTRRSRRAARGLSLVDAMIATVILLTAALGGLASICTSHQVNQSTGDFAVATETLNRFVERMRADPDWSGLYARLNALSAESTGDTALARLGADLKLPT